MAYEPLETLAEKLGIVKKPKPLFTDPVQPFAPFRQQAQQNASSLVNKGKGIVKQAVANATRPMPPLFVDGKIDRQGAEAVANVAGGFVGGGMKNVGNVVSKGINKVNKPITAAVVTGLGSLAANESLSRTEYNAPTKSLLPTKQYSFNRQDFANRIVNVENERAVATSTSPYEIIGVSGDLGKYQVNPEVLNDWSEAWLGKKYSEQEFLNDKQAQETFFNEFMNVAEKYNLTPAEAAVTWHRGWGELGTGSKETREQRFRDQLNKMMKEQSSQYYLTKFNR